MGGSSDAVASPGCQIPRESLGKMHRGGISTVETTSREMQFERVLPSGSHGGSLGVRLGLEDEIKSEKCQENCERVVETV